ncbi:MAG: type II toxin-antitoxin system death-on-curing family toxin [Candidatus Omnitrophica bacterium]|nr:type II toxin-antitoxin system death-on-curing family toxin [Candidatus Omnitrophota bacterium]
MSADRQRRNLKNNILPKGEIVIYRTSNKRVKLEVKLEKETVWLDAHQIALLFGVNRPAIVKHINNIYKTAELSENSTCSILEQVAADGKIRKMNLYNLDMIISVGYRVNSKMATQFRIWATHTLKEHIVKGYTINEKRLLKQTEKFKNLQETIAFLQVKSHYKLLADQTKEILNLLSEYAKSLSVLEQYDANKLTLVKGKKAAFVLTYENCAGIILEIRKELISKKQISELFGQEVDKKFESIIKNLYQTFGGNELYESIEEKSAHLLYLTIKDHPFVDGNKRVASLLFVYFLERNRYLYKPNGERKINDNALVALSLLIAISEPKEKDVMIKIITNLLK